MVAVALFTQSLPLHQNEIARPINESDDKQMILFIDTEFSDFINTELLSIGLVDQLDRTFYAEVPFEFKECSNFVREAVIPQLGKIPGAQCTLEELKVRLLEWLSAYKDDEDPLAVCFDYSGDWTLFCGVLDNEVPGWIRGVNVNGDINHPREELFWRDHPELKRHHALHDAMALKASFVLSHAEDRDSLNRNSSRKF